MFIAIVAVIGPVVLGALAFLRTTRYAKIILALEDRVRTLEDTVKDGVVVREERVVIREEVRVAVPEQPAQPSLEAPPPVLAPPPQAPQPEPIIADPHVAPPTPAPEPEPAIAARVKAARIEEPAPAAEPAAPTEGPGLAWVYWLAGGALAAVAVIGLGMAAGAGMLGPSAQIVGGLLLAGGLLYGATTLPRLPDGKADGKALLLSGVGLFCGFASALAGVHLLQAWSPVGGLAAWGAFALGGLALGAVFGPGFAWAGAITGFMGPLFFRAPPSDAFVVAAYVAAIVAVTLAFARLGGWRLLTWSTVAASLAWGGGLTWLMGVGAAPAAAAYLVGLAVIAAAAAWDASAGPAPLIGPNAQQPDPHRPDGVLGWPEPFVATHFLAGGALAQMAALFFVAGPAAWPVGVALIVMAALTIAVAVLREGFSLLALVASGMAVAAVALWPSGDGAASALTYPATAAIAIGLFATLGGWAMVLRHTAPTTGALIASLVPVAALLAARLRLGDFEMPWAYGLGAAALAGAFGFAFWKLQAAAPQERRFAPASAFAVGSALAAALAIGSALPGLWLAAGLAVLAPMAALADRRFDVPGARAAIGGVGVLVVGILTVGLAPVQSVISTTPIANELVIVYVIAVVALYSTASIMARARGEDGLPEALRMGCVYLVVAFAAFTIRHLVHAGDMRAPYANTVEIGLQAAAVITAALMLAFRYADAPKRPLLRWTQTSLVGLGLALGLGLVFLVNPAWGMYMRPNAYGLEFAYGAPTLALAAYSYLRARQAMPERAAIAGWAAAALGLVWLTLSVRAAADGVQLSGTPISMNAHWALSIAWFAFAAALGAVSVAHPVPGFKQASAAIFVATLVKVFVIDLSPLDLIMRVFATLLVGALAVGAAMVYQRFVFARGGQRMARRRTDPNLMPPN